MAEVTLQTKIWGETECLLSTPMLQLHRIAFLRGGVCSEHFHRSRFNAFYVLEGRLLVRRWFQEAVKEDVLFPGEYLTVSPLVRHQFEGLTDGKALELYYPDEVNEHDIVRLTQGFMR